MLPLFQSAIYLFVRQEFISLRGEYVTFFHGGSCFPFSRLSFVPVAKTYSYDPHRIFFRFYDIYAALVNLIIKRLKEDLPINYVNTTKNYTDPF